MTVTVRTLFLLGAGFLALVKINGAPAKYDQRQEGEFNLHAQLQNFMFVVAIPSSNELLGDLALQALEFKQQLSSRASSSGELEQELSIKVDDVVQDEKPYTLEVIRISEDHQQDSEKIPISQIDRKSPSVSSDLRSASVNSAQGKTTSGHAGRTAKNVRSFEFPKSREVPPAVLGHGLVDAIKVSAESKAEDAGRGRNVLENPVRNPESGVDLTGKPGASLKKQLFRQGEQEEQVEVEDAVSSANVQQDGTGSAAEPKQQELRLLGDAVENCGPGWHRDAAGICQESADSLL